MKKCLTIISILLTTYAFAQQTTTTTIATYPKTVGYFSVVHPLVTVDKDETVYNFSNGAYTVGFPFGINVLTSNTAGFSLEIVPLIRSTNGLSRTSNVLFHPGYIIRRPHGFNIITRAAFETAGRYGASLVFNKVVAKTKTNNFFVSTPILFRVGNDRPASLALALQLGISF